VVVDRKAFEFISNRYHSWIHRFTHIQTLGLYILH